MLWRRFDGKCAVCGVPIDLDNFGEARTNTIRAVCAVARDQGPPVNGTNQHSDRGRDHNHTQNKTHGSTDAVYLARRILGEDTEVFEQLERGDYRSVRAAAIQAGIVKPSERLTVLQQTQRWYSKLSDTERQQFMEWVAIIEPSNEPPARKAAQ